MSGVGKQFLIYVLHHPESKHVYIGKTTRGMRRTEEHFHPSHLKKYANLPRSKWIQSLRKRSFEPQVAILEELATSDGLDDAERFHIASFRAMGIPLLNLTDGGDGVLGMQFTDESIAKMSATRKKRVAEIPGECERLATLSDSYWSDDVMREKKRQERIGQKWSEETKAKMSASHKGKSKSPEARAKMAEAARRRWEDSNYREQQIEAQKISHSSDEKRAQAAEWAKLSSHDTHRSPEYRAKQSERAKASCASAEVRARKSEAAKLKAQDPVYRAKLSEVRKLWWAKRRPKDEDAPQ